MTDRQARAREHGSWSSQTQRLSIQSPGIAILSTRSECGARSGASGCRNGASPMPVDGVHHACVAGSHHEQSGYFCERVPNLWFVPRRMRCKDSSPEEPVGHAHEQMRAELAGRWALVGMCTCSSPAFEVWMGTSMSWKGNYRERRCPEQAACFKWPPRTRPSLSRVAKDTAVKPRRPSLKSALDLRPIPSSRA